MPKKQSCVEIRAARATFAFEGSTRAASDVYRRQVLEILQDESLQIYRVHLADSNRDGGIIDQIKQQAAARNIEVCFHSRPALSRISRNSKQDQGAACDIHCPGYQPYEQALQKTMNGAIIALDGVTNPQNLGMIIRSVTASPAHGLLLPSKGTADISPLAGGNTAYDHAKILRIGDAVECNNSAGHCLL